MKVAIHAGSPDAVTTAGAVTAPRSKEFGSAIRVAIDSVNTAVQFPMASKVAVAAVLSSNARVTGQLAADVSPNKAVPQSADAGTQQRDRRTLTNSIHDPVATLPLALLPGASLPGSIPLPVASPEPIAQTPQNTKGSQQKVVPSAVANLGAGLAAQEFTPPPTGLSQAGPAAQPESVAIRGAAVPELPGVDKAAIANASLGASSRNVLQSVTPSEQSQPSGALGGGAAAAGQSGGRADSQHDAGGVSLPLFPPARLVLTAAGAGGTPIARAVSLKNAAATTPAAAVLPAANHPALTQALSDIDGRAVVPAVRPKTATAAGTAAALAAVQPFNDGAPRVAASSASPIAFRSLSPIGTGDLPDAPSAPLSAAHTFARLDAAVPWNVTPLRTDLRTLEVGVQSGSLGWVEVRATTDAQGQISASLHAQSEIGAQSLAGHVEHIATFAQQHAVTVDQLSVGPNTGESSQQHQQGNRGGSSTNSSSALGPTAAETRGGEEESELSSNSLISVHV